MVRCWRMSDCTEGVDQWLPLQLDPPQPVSLEDLRESTGVLHWKVDADNYEEEGLLDKIRTERGYSYQDFFEISRTTLPNYEETIASLFKEHLHAHEEIRFTLGGNGYLDVRDPEDKWIRVRIEKGDLIVLPSGMYHRFALDEKNYIKLMRLFVGDPVWKAHNRPADDMPTRKEYVKRQANKFA